MSIWMIISTVVLCLGTKNWWTMWLMMEVNSIAFIMFMVKKSMKEKIFKFFLFQTLASSLLMMFIFFSSWMSEKNSQFYLLILVFTSVLLKIGMFPFQSWMVSLMKSFPWYLLTILLTWQKLIPLLLINKSNTIINPSVFLMMSMALMSVVMVKMTSSKMMMALSSLIHNSWMILVIFMFKMVSMMYLMMYSILVMMLMKQFKLSFSEKFILQNFKKNNSIESLSTLMALSGIPPSMGFFAKMTIILMILKMNMQKPWMILLFMASCMSFFVYFMIFMKILTMKININMKKNMFSKTKDMKKSIILNSLPMIVMAT